MFLDKMPTQFHPWVGLLFALFLSDCSRPVTDSPADLASPTGATADLALDLCRNGIKDGRETDVDCGGDRCPACDDGKACSRPADCRSASCTKGICRQLQFAAPMMYPLNAVQSAGITVADFDQDGKPDVAFNDAQLSNTFILHNDGGGKLSVSKTYLQGSAEIVSADFDGDGRVDLASGTNDRAVALLMNVGGGAFAQALQIPTPLRVHSLRTTDVDKDGRPDMVTPGSLDSEALFIALLNQGAGKFLTIQTMTIGDTPSIGVADFDNDGMPDVATAYFMKNYGRIYFNTGGGSFKRSIDIYFSDVVFGLAPADFDGDGFTDLAVGQYTAANVNVYRGHGLMGIDTRKDYPIQGRTSLITADLDGDARPDLLAVGGPTVSVLINDGAGGFKPALLLPAVTEPAAMVSGFLAVGDLNGDGKLDIVASYYRAVGPDGGGVSVLLNTSP